MTGPGVFGTGSGAGAMAGAGLDLNDSSTRHPRGVGALRHLTHPGPDLDPNPNPRPRPRPRSRSSIHIDRCSTATVHNNSSNRGGLSTPLVEQGQGQEERGGGGQGQGQGQAEDHERGQEQGPRLAEAMSRSWKDFGRAPSSAPAPSTSTSTFPSSLTRTSSGMRGMEGGLTAGSGGGRRQRCGTAAALTRPRSRPPTSNSSIDKVGDGAGRRTRTSRSRRGRKGSTSSSSNSRSERSAAEEAALYATAADAAKAALDSDGFSGWKNKSQNKNKSKSRSGSRASSRSSGEVSRGGGRVSKGGGGGTGTGTDKSGGKEVTPGSTTRPTSALTSTSEADGSEAPSSTLTSRPVFTLSEVEKEAGSGAAASGRHGGGVTRGALLSPLSEELSRLSLAPATTAGKSRVPNSVLDRDLSPPCTPRRGDGLDNNVTRSSVSGGLSIPVSTPTYTSLGAGSARNSPATTAAHNILMGREALRGSFGFDAGDGDGGLKKVAAGSGHSAVRRRQSLDGRMVLTKDAVVEDNAAI